MANGKESSQTLKALLGIRDMVLGGHFPAGERLSEVPLAEQLGISRTPIRAALARLEQEGLLERSPAGGYLARGFSIDEVIDSIELRGVLEGTAARFAAERGVEPRRLREILKNVDAMGDLLGRDVSILDFESYVELNAEFHEMLAGLAGSETLRREIERATKLPFASPSAFLEKQGEGLVARLSLLEAQSHHRAIVEAIRLREGARAEAMAREHARLARHNLEAMLHADEELMQHVVPLKLISP